MQSSVKYSDRAVQPLLMEVQGISTTADCSDDALSFPTTVFLYLGTGQSSGGMFEGLVEEAAATSGRCNRREISSGPSTRLVRRLWHLDPPHLFTNCPLC